MVGVAPGSALPASAGRAVFEAHPATATAARSVPYKVFLITISVSSRVLLEFDGCDQPAGVYGAPGAPHH
jgi:hypothetical protein